jgi:hypothetical protein
VGAGAPPLRASGGTPATGSSWQAWRFRIINQRKDGEKCGRSRHSSTCSWYGLGERGRYDLGVGTPEHWRAVGSDGRRVACGCTTGRGSAPAVVGDACADNDCTISSTSPAYPEAADAHLLGRSPNSLARRCDAIFRASPQSHHRVGRRSALLIQIQDRRAPATYVFMRCWQVRML